jgi:putative membrane protein
MVYALLAHPAVHLSASASPWLSWNVDPTLLLGIPLLAGAYFYAIGPLRRRLNLGPPAATRQVAMFLTAILTLTLALMSPLDTLGDRYLFSAHMVQHMLLAVVCPPLLLMGMPDWLVAWLLAPVVRNPAALAVARLLTNPFVAFFLFNGALYLWHIPPLYDATLSNEGLHVFEHLIFLVTGVLFWWPVLSAVPALPRLSRPVGIMYLFLACQPMVLLGALLTFAQQPFYLPYDTAPRVWGLSPLEDQQLGGLIMWLPTNIPYLIALSVLFFQWVGERDLAERIVAGELATDEIAADELADELADEPESAQPGTV